MCEIPSRRFNTVFTGLLLGSGPLPPEFCQQMCEIPSRRFNTLFTGPFARSRLTSARFCQPDV